jgi:hypothetical protein
MGNSFCIVGDTLIALPCGAFWFLVIGLPVLLIAAFCCCCCCCGRGNSNPPNIQLPPPVSHRDGVAYQPINSQEKRPCLHCQAALVESAKFCCFCGVAVKENCSSCGADLSSLPAEARCCAQCGNAFCDQFEASTMK